MLNCLLLFRLDNLFILKLIPPLQIKLPALQCKNNMNKIILKITGLGKKCFRQNIK